MHRELYKNYYGFVCQEASQHKNGRFFGDSLFFWCVRKEEQLLSCIETIKITHTHTLMMLRKKGKNFLCFDMRSEQQTQCMLVLNYCSFCFWLINFMFIIMMVR
jgi:hypothetical protein